MALELKTDAFKPDEEIPSRYTCEAENISPGLQWENPPNKTKSFALIADDPDAPVGTWVHWVVYDIPETSRGFEENVITDGAVEGKTDFGKTGYGGPCPPEGKPHRYYFKLYALNELLKLEPGRTKTDLLQAMQGHILAEAELMGKYQRKD